MHEYRQMLWTIGLTFVGSWMSTFSDHISLDSAFVHRPSALWVYDLINGTSPESVYVYWYGV